MATKHRTSAAKVSKLIENAIALAGDVFGSPEFAAFREKHVESFGGVTGIYSAIQRMAEALTDYETRKRIDWGCDDRFPEWFEVCEALAGEFLKTGDIPDVETVINRIPK